MYSIYSNYIAIVCDLNLEYAMLFRND
jgi:hypothetical protein